MLQLCELEERGYFPIKMQEFTRREQNNCMISKSNNKKSFQANMYCFITRDWKFFLGKLKFRWSGPFKLINVYPYEIINLQDERTGQKFKVNGQRVEHYIGVNVNNSKEDLFLKNLVWANKKGQAERLKIKYWFGRQPNEGSDFKDFFKYFNSIFVI